MSVVRNAVKTTVRRAYVTNTAGETRRSLVDNRGRVNLGDDWYPVMPADRVVPVGPVLERWVDVPAAWLGVCPWFR